MGLRNFSYSVLDLSTQYTVPPLLSAWCVTDILQQASIPLEDSSEQGSSRFSSALAADLAYSVFAESILPKYNPDVIILEQQRLRSGGGSNVIEWTLRINMFESALHGVLVALRKQGKSTARVYDVLPGRTKGYWIRPTPSTVCDEEKVIRTSKKSNSSTYAMSKAVKVDLVKRWTENVSFEKPDACRHVVFSQDTIPLAQQFHSRRSRQLSSLPQSTTLPRNFKLDDLSDSLLQGVAYIEWQQHQFALASALKAGADLTAFHEELNAKHEKAMLSV